jgi:hypothetical protein
LQIGGVDRRLHIEQGFGGGKRCGERIWLPK